MKWGLIEISDLTDEQLVAAFRHCQAVIDSRDEAHKHPKFNQERTIENKVIKPLEKPPVNPLFMDLIKEIKSEIEKRKPVYKGQL